MNKINIEFDLIGIGIGPSNLSTACLLNGTKITSLFLDKKDEWSWHPGMQIKNSMLQVSFLKDPVTLIDPTNYYSFLNYLSQSKLLCKFLNRRNAKITREEFCLYYKWIIKNLNNLQFKSKILNIDYKSNVFLVKTLYQNYKSRNLVIAIGKEPRIPNFAKNCLSNRVFHSSKYCNFSENIKSKKNNIVIIGGGQSSAEIFDDLIDHSGEITWITRRDNFIPMDDNSFANELHTPSHTNYFYNMPYSIKKELLNKFIYTSDGVSEELLNNIYEKIYYEKLSKGNCNRIKLYSLTELTNIKKLEESKYQITMKNLITNSSYERDSIDYIILSTGYEDNSFSLLENIKHRIDYESNGHFSFNNDFSLKGEFGECKIFLNGVGAKYFGVSDPNLSMMPWRSAKIINSILKKKQYETDIDELILGAL